MINWEIHSNCISYVVFLDNLFVSLFSKKSVEQTTKCTMLAVI